MTTSLNSREQEEKSLRIVRHKEVKLQLGISSAKLYDMVAKGEFPKPFCLIPNGRAKGWLLHEVDDWILNRRHSDDGVSHE